MKLHIARCHGLKIALSCVAMAAYAVTHAATLIDKNVQVITPAVPTADPFSVSSAGTLTMKVNDLAFPDYLQSLSFAVSNSTGVLKSSTTGADTFSLDITGPMNLFANVFAVPKSDAGSGLYHINVSFIPSALPSVPLPAASGLLLFALTSMGGLAGFFKRRHE